MSRVAVIGIAIAALATLPGCLINRRITDFAAHPTYNNYKVETSSTYYAFFTSWNEYDAWTCQKLGEAFHCTKVEYDASKGGFHGFGPGNAPPAKATNQGGEP